MTFDKIMKKVENLSHDEIVILGKDSLEKMKKGLKEDGLKSDQIDSFVLNTIKLFVSADSRCTEEEYELINAIMPLNLTFDEFFDKTNNGRNQEFVNSFDEFIDNANDDLKEAVCLFGVAILASDGKVNYVEQNLLEKIIK